MQEDDTALTDEPRVTITPRPVMGVVRHGLRLYVQHAAPLWQILAPLALAAQLVAVLVTVSSVPAGSVVSNGTIYVPPGTSLSHVALARVVAALFEALIGVVTVGATVRLLTTTVLGRPEGPGDAFRYAFRRTGPLVWLSLMYAVLVVAGGFLLIIPGIYLAVAFTMAIPALIIEDLRGGVALTRSRQLTKGRWWATLGALIPASLIGGALAIAITLAMRVSGSVTAYALAGAASGLIIQVFITPVSIATLVAIYIDLRARKEPEQLSTAVAVDPSTPPPTPIGDPWY
jgi:hypothetical protein